MSRDVKVPQSRVTFIDVQGAVVSDAAEQNISTNLVIVRQVNGIGPFVDSSRFATAILSDPTHQNRFIPSRLCRPGCGNDDQIRWRPQNHLNGLAGRAQVVAILSTRRARCVEREFEDVVERVGTDGDEIRSRNLFRQPHFLHLIVTLLTFQLALMRKCSEERRRAKP